jgi:hypothetical protein
VNENLRKAIEKELLKEKTYQSTVITSHSGPDCDRQIETCLKAAKLFGKDYLTKKIPTDKRLEITVNFLSQFPTIGALKRRKSKRYAKTLKKYDTMPTEFKNPITILKNKKAIELLRIIEARSKLTKGVTKIKQTALAELLDITKRQVYNLLNLLENHNYITRLSDNLSRYNANTSKRYFQTIRLIRANRIVLRNRCRLPLESYWEPDLDIRPEVVSGVCVPQMETLDKKWWSSEKGFPYQTYVEQFEANIYDDVTETFYREALANREKGDPRAIKILGFPVVKRTAEENARIEGYEGKGYYSFTQHFNAINNI